MQIKNLVIAFFTGCLLLAACSRKHHPQITTNETNIEAAKPVIVKPLPAKVIHSPVPKMLTIYGGMQKSVDGRLYYDLEGRRYWKNYDDGKYYLFNKRMFTDAAFKPH
jgi:hypothetical protein